MLGCSLTLLPPLLSAAGVDGQVKVWDIRTYQLLHAYFANTPATLLDISQRGLLAVGQGRRVQVHSGSLSLSLSRAGPSQPPAPPFLPPAPPPPQAHTHALAPARPPAPQAHRL
jgi:hypothetical protein